MYKIYIDRCVKTCGAIFTRSISISHASLLKKYFDQAKREKCHIQHFYYKHKNRKIDYFNMHLRWPEVQRFKLSYGPEYQYQSNYIVFSLKINRSGTDRVLKHAIQKEIVFTFTIHILNMQFGNLIFIKYLLLQNRTGIIFI